MRPVDRGPDTPALSVVIATRDRRQDLARCLASLLGDPFAPPGFEVVVVDNGSSDGTRDEVGRLACTTATTLRLVPEPVVGLSAARNTGVDAARGAVVVFLDDDVTVDPGLVAAYLAAFTDDRISAAGGPVRPVWPGGARPGWLPDGADRYLSVVDHGPRRRPILHPELVVGANMAFRRSVLLDRPFRTDLGRRGRSLLSGEESERFLALARDGGRVLWVPEAIAHHQLPPSRVRAGWLARRAFGQGRSEVLLAHLRRGLLAPGARHEPLDAGLELRAAALDGWRRTLSPRRSDGPRRRATDDLTRRARHLGRAVEILRTRSRAPRSRPAASAADLRIAATLVVRDEVDVVEGHLRFHLAHGVDLLLVTDHRSSDGTSEVLARFERLEPDRVLVVREDGAAFDQGRWVTRMARHAAARGADWVVHLDADEFLVADDGTLRGALEATPADVGVLRVRRLNFVLRHPTAEPWFERLSVRERSPIRHTGEHSPSKVIHRASVAARVAVGNHEVTAPGLGRTAGTDRLTLLHFPYRSADQVVRKITAGAGAVRALDGSGKMGRHWLEQDDLLRERGPDALVARWLLTEDEVARGLEEGTLITDTRVADALRSPETDRR